MTPERRAWCWLIAGTVACAAIGAFVAHQFLRDLEDFRL